MSSNTNQLIAHYLDTATRIISTMPDNYEKVSAITKIIPVLFMAQHEMFEKPAARTDLENKPKEKVAAAAAPTPAPAVSAPSPVPATPAFKNLNKQAQVNIPATTAPAQTQVPAAPAPDSTAPAIPAGWETKTLTPEEMDDSWTYKMLSNNGMKAIYTKLVGFCYGGLKQKAFSITWLNAALNKITEGKITEFDSPNSIPPKMANLIVPTLMKVYQEARAAAKKTA